MIIAIDFDGTCVTHEYPDVERSIGAVSVLKKIIDEFVDKVKECYSNKF